MNPLKTLAAVSIALAAAACSQAGTAELKTDTNGIGFAAHTAADPGLLPSLGHALTPAPTTFPAPRGGPNVNRIEFAAETASNPALLPSLGAAMDTGTDPHEVPASDLPEQEGL